MSTTPPERDWDAEFANIAAHLEDPPVRENPRPAAPATERPTTDPAPSAASTPLTYVPRQHIPPEEDDDFVPEPPRPLPSDDPATMIMIGSVIVGPLWLGYLALFARESRQLWWVLASLLCILGLVLAIMRQPRSRSDDDPDDGARL